jgi:hypothetical protein
MEAIVDMIPGVHNGSDRRRLKETFKLTGTFTDLNHVMTPLIPKGPHPAGPCSTGAAHHPTGQARGEAAEETADQAQG